MKRSGHDLRHTCTSSYIVPGSGREYLAWGGGGIDVASSHACEVYI